MTQLLVNILTLASLYAILVLSFQIIYRAVRFLHIAHAAAISLGGYFTYLYSVQVELNLTISIVLSMLSVTLLFLVIHLTVYEKLLGQKADSWRILIASLGIYVILENVIAVVWGNHILSFRSWPVVEGIRFLDAYIKPIHLIGFISMLVVFISVYFLQKTVLGKSILAVSSNHELSTILGLSSRKVLTSTLVIGTIIASVAGVLIASDRDISHQMGFSWFMSCLIAMIIGGIGGYRSIIFGSIFLSVFQNLGAYYFDSKWMEGFAYLTLVLFLFWKPYGLSGFELKKAKV